jgi:hypothetical protein
MEFPLKLRTLYLLALFQLVAGPLVLFQVSVLSKMVVREAPTHGISKAVSLAWNSPEFQAALSEGELPELVKSKQTAPTSDPKATLVKVKMPCIDWQDTRLVWVNASTPVPRTRGARTWTPAWPQPPPGPPPRVG